MIRRFLCAIAIFASLNGTASAAPDADGWEPSKKVASLCRDFSTISYLSLTAKANGKSEEATLAFMLDGVNEDYARIRREAVRVAYEEPQTKVSCAEFLKPYDIAEQAQYRQLFSRHWKCHLPGQPVSVWYAFNMEGRAGFLPNPYQNRWEDGQYYVKGNQVRIKLWWQVDKNTPMSSVATHTFNRIDDNTLQLDAMSCRNDS